jgi:hypothetical protein
MDAMKIQRAENVTDARLKSKELFIECLESQLKLRDKIINEQTSMVKSHNLENGLSFDLTSSLIDFESLEELGNNSRFVYPYRRNQISSHRLKESSLPPILSSSKIPKPNYRRNLPSLNVSSSDKFEDAPKRGKRY